MNKNPIKCIWRKNLRVCYTSWDRIFEHDSWTRFSGLIFDKQDFQFGEGSKLMDLLEHHNGELNSPVRYLILRWRGRRRLASRKARFKDCFQIANIAHTKIWKQWDNILKNVFLLANLICDVENSTLRPSLNIYFL